MSTHYRPIRGVNSERWKASLDQWRTNADADAPDCQPYGHVLRYRCLEPGCTWTGSGGLAAWDHHRSVEPHHAVALRASGTRQLFPCCEERTR